MAAVALYVLLADASGPLLSSPVSFADQVVSSAPEEYDPGGPVYGVSHGPMLSSGSESPNIVLEAMSLCCIR